jgi:hypothetical protein
MFHRVVSSTGTHIYSDYLLYKCLMPYALCLLTFTQITCFSSYLLCHSDLLRLLALLVQKYKYWHRVVSSTCTQFTCFTSTKVQELTEWYGVQCLRPSPHARTAACSPSIRQVLTLLALLWYKRTRTDTRGGHGASSLRPHTPAAKGRIH